MAEPQNEDVAIDVDTDNVPDADNVVDAENNLDAGNNHDANNVVDAKTPGPPLEYFAKMPVKKNATHYNMNHKKIGNAIIFINKFIGENGVNRTKADRVTLTKALKTWGFKVTVVNDAQPAKVSAFFEKMNKKRKQHSDKDCILIAVLNSGAVGRLYARENLYMPDMLWRLFTSQQCATLAGKPKVFICQSYQEERANYTRSDPEGILNSIDGIYNFPNINDFSLSIATMPGSASFNNNLKGSPYIQSVCKEMKPEKDIQDFTMVHKKVAIDFNSVNPCPEKDQQKQTPLLITTMRHRLNLMSDTKRTRTFGNIPHLINDIMQYDIKNKKRMAIIVANENFDNLPQREGTDIDCDDLEHCLISLGFEVNVLYDKRAREIINIFDELSQMDFSDYGALFVAVMTHGDLGKLCGKDDDYHYDIDVLWKGFTDKCPTLRGKPKEFLIQACQGGKYDSGVTLTRTGLKEDPYDDPEPSGSRDQNSSYKISNDCDFLVLQAQEPLETSSENGTVFIKEISEMLNNAEGMNFLDCCTILANKLNPYNEQNNNEPNEGRRINFRQINSLTRKFVLRKKRRSRNDNACHDSPGGTTSAKTEEKEKPEQ